MRLSREMSNTGVRDAKASVSARVKELGIGG